MISVNRATAKMLILAAAKSSRTPHMIGPPGNGKTSLALECAAELGLPYVPFRTSTKLPEDAGGYMSPDNVAGVVHAMPLEALARICREPCFFHIDEMINGSLAVRAGLLQILDERRIGDMKLHPGTVVCLTSNPENQSTGGIAESLPERNRCVRFMLAADLAAWQTWIRSEADKANAAPEWSQLAHVVAATMNGAPELWAAEPPMGIEAGTEGWASSRAWHIAIDVVATLLAAGEKLNGPACRAALAGTLGETTADVFLTLYGLRNELPSVDAIVTNPKGAALPASLRAAIAALGVIAEVGRRDACAAWIYASRLSDEIQLAAGTVCTAFPIKLGGSPHANDAQPARNVLLAKLNSAKAGH